MSTVFPCRVRVCMHFPQLFRSKAFKALLEKMLGASVVASRRQARRFRPGLDYTLATPGAPWEWKGKGSAASATDVSNVSSATVSDAPESGDGGDGGGGGGKEGQAVEAEEEEEEDDFMVLDAVLCFVDDREPYKEAAWKQDEVGGYVTYLGGDDDGNDNDDDGDNNDNGMAAGGSTDAARDGATERTPVTGASASTATTRESSKAGGASGGAKNDAAVYKADEGGSLVSVSAASNALSLVLRDDAEITSFVKYVSSAAPGSRFDVAGEYLVVGAGAQSDDSSCDEGGRGGVLLETVPEGESGEEEDEEEEDEDEPLAGGGEDERSRKRMKAS